MLISWRIIIPSTWHFRLIVIIIKRKLFDEKKKNDSKNRLVPSYPKFIAPEDHRVDATDDVVNSEIQHLVGRCLSSMILRAAPEKLDNYSADDNVRGRESSRQYPCLVIH